VKSAVTRLVYVVVVLEGETSTLSASVAGSAAANAYVNSQSMKMLSMQKNASANKDRCKMMVAQLQKADNDQATMHISLLKMFMPEQRFKMDADAVRLVLLLGSLAEKSAIVAAFARDQFHLEENVQTILTTGDLTGVHVA